MRQPPISTYRLQLHAQFRFSDATALVPYLDALGVSDVYASPFLKASPGSLHGYDICDHSQLNPEIGDEASFDAWTSALAAREMGLILDFVPNHMGLDARMNPWWRDVLTHGQSSRFADYFDIDWDPITAELKNRILLPILQDPYGEVLERGDLRLAFRSGEFVMQYFDRELPMDPRTTAPLLRAAIEAGPETQWQRSVADVATLLEQLPVASSRTSVDRRRREREAALARDRLVATAETSPEAVVAISSAVAILNGVPESPRSFDRLHDLLEAQPYRLAYWRTAFDEINYRRFFDVNDLGGLCMERPQVFGDAHRLILRLIGEGKIRGLRIDHPDGLFDPAEYFRRLQRAATRGLKAAMAEEARDGDGLPEEARFYVLAEKILAHGETLPDYWPVAGTTGYGFMNVLNGVFVDSRQQRQLLRVYAKITGRSEPFSEVAYHSKRLIMSSSLSSELSVLAGSLKELAEADRVTRDFTVNALRRALVEVVACFPIYRTYVRRSGFSASDREAIDNATDRARRLNPVMPSSIFLFIRRVLLASADHAPLGVDVEEWVNARRAFAMKFQQFSAPVHAKGVEDTAYYRYVALLSLNEVGGDPARFGGSIEHFHAGNRVRLERWPLEMNATSTHDTKRGEDARARLNVLSEVPDAWRHMLASWMRINARRRSIVDHEPAPDHNDEYLYYQALLGAWPAEPDDATLPAEADAELVLRMRQYMQKAIKEAKRHTSWVTLNAAYEDAVTRFVDTTLSGPAAKPFLASFVPFAREIAARGMVNALAQLLLKIAAPGVPDFYQGTEGWALHLADPDNRRPVDFAGRQAMLDDLMPWIERAERCCGSTSMEPGEVDGHLEEQISHLLRHWQDGRIKMFVTACGLRLRRREWPLFLHGRYDALGSAGLRHSHVIAFARSLNGGTVIAAVPRLTGAYVGAALPIGAEAWGDTSIVLPRECGAKVVRNILTGAIVAVNRESESPALLVSEVFRTCPVAWLWTA